MSLTKAHCNGFWLSQSQPIFEISSAAKILPKDSSKVANPPPPPAHSTKKPESKPVHPAQPGYAAAKLKAHAASKQPSTDGPVSAAMLADALKAAATSVSPLGPTPSSQSGSAYEDNSYGSWLAEHGLVPMSGIHLPPHFLADQPSTSGKPVQMWVF